MGSKQSKPASVATGTVTTTNNNDESQIMKNNMNESEVKNTFGENNEKGNNCKMPNDSIHKNLGAITGGGCPMKKNGGGYLGGWFGGKNKSKDTSTAIDNAATSTAATNNDKPTPSSGCPVKHDNKESACPVKQNNNVQYNVYSQPIDPNNNMPSVANQLPSPLQNEPLSTTRVKSTIPKGSTDGSTWTYPSPQMFYNSLARKNKLGDTTEAEVESVVALHNNMNEKTWSKVIEWEEALVGSEDGKESKLLKFLGRPSDLSPKAQFKNLLFGHPLPFDRHDWTIVRKDGTEVRYVIDYYHDETRASEIEDSGMPAMDDYDAVKSILVDVRPAADNPQLAFGRAVTMPMARHLHNTTKFVPLPILPTTELKSQITESEKVWANIQQNVKESKQRADSKSMVLKPEDIPEDQREESKVGDDTMELPDISDEEAKEIALSFASMIGTCKDMQTLVQNCKDETECAQVSLGLTMCLAKVVCPLQQNAVALALNDDDLDMEDEKAVAAYNATFEKTLENMSICVNAKSQKVAIARQTHPHLFKDISA